MFLDTNIIIEIFRARRNSSRFKEIYKHIQDEQLFISIFQLGEMSDWSLANNIEPLEPVKALKELVNIVPLTEDICLDASNIKFEMRGKGVNKFSLADGIIIATARHIKQQLLTTDKDFRKAKDAILIG